jgi:hypothetical protein
MALTRLQNIISSVEGRILYVNPDDFDATDAIDNKGNSPIRPFKTIARAMLEVARYSYVSAGNADDKFDQFTILLYPGDHVVDNRPGEHAYKLDGGNYTANISPFQPTADTQDYGWSDSLKVYQDLYKITNSNRGGLIIPRGTSIIGLDLRKTKIRPKYIPYGNANTAATETTISWTVNTTNRKELTITSVSGGNINDLIIGSYFEKDVTSGNTVLIPAGTAITDIDCNLVGGNVKVTISKDHNYTTNGDSGSGIVNIPYEDDNSRTALFKITGGCYFWQFTILDGDPSGVYTSGAVNTGVSLQYRDPEFSHTKLTVFEYASLHELHTYYRKVSDAISIISCEKIEPKIQENRIVGPLADSVGITRVRRNGNQVIVTLNEELNITSGNYVSIIGEGNFITGSSNTNSYYVGAKQVSSVNNRSEFVFTLSSTDESALSALESGSDEDPTASGVQITYIPSSTAKAEVEIDTVESASPYIFNISLRSTWGTCGMHADGSRATGFKSMVVAQYTGISLQKDDRAYFEFDNSTNSYVNVAGKLYHKDINAIYKPAERSYHIKASNRAVIQAVSVFAVGYADHFIAVDGGDMSITNSNSNFGSNAIRSIGYSDVAFKKDALGEITHIIPPRNVESSDSNIYWESIDTVKSITNADPTKRLYLRDRTTFLQIDSGGNGFNGTPKQVLDPTGATKTLNLTVNGNGTVTAVAFLNNDYGAFQPGDNIHLVSDTIGGLPSEITIGGTLTKEVNKYVIGNRTLNPNGATTVDKIYVPLYVGSATTTTEVSSNIKRSTLGNVFEYDFTNSNWYVNIDDGYNEIRTTLAANTAKYGAGKIEATPTAYLKRVKDERTPNDKIYRLRYVTKRSSDGILPSYPQPGYVLQQKKGVVSGLGDRWADAHDLILINKEFIAREAFARVNPTMPGGTTSQDCIDDVIDVLESLAYNIKFGGTDKIYDAANLYVTGNHVQGEETATINIFNQAKAIAKQVIDNTTVSIQGTHGLTQKKTNTQPQVIAVGGGCTDVVAAIETLFTIVTTAVQNDNMNHATRTTPSATYNRTSGHEYDEVYYIYEVEEVVKYSYNATTGVEVPGVYYLTVIRGSIPISNAVLLGSTFKFSQNTDDLYPTIDIDNVVSDPKIAKSIADIQLIGKVKTTNGLSSFTTDPIDTSYSVTKEAVSYFLDEYLNNSLQWDWSGKQTTGSIVRHELFSPNVFTNITSGSGGSEIRKIPIRPDIPTDTIAVELRRPSTIRSGNHTFEYVGFGPGNYSTAFPIRQTKILTNEEQKYAQSIKEQGGVAFYSGLNSNGDLYIGNTVINAVTGKTSENQIDELTELTITDNLNVLGGSGNTLTSNFQGPVNFLNEIVSDASAIFANVKLRNQDGIISTITNNDTTPVSGVVGDYIFNVQPTEGSNVGWMYTDKNEWRQVGLLGSEKIHSYKSGSNYVLNVGQDRIDIDNNTTVNVNYDLDVTTRQRVGTHLDIGTGATSAITSNSGTKQTRLYIQQAWTGDVIEYKPLLIKLTTDTGANPANRVIDIRDAADTSIFNVDKNGNVTIKSGSSYGLSNSAFCTVLTVKSNSNAANNEIAITSLAGSPVSVQIPDYTGGTAGSNITYTYGFRTATDISTYKFQGAANNITDFNTRSILLFINGVLQSPFINYYFDGTYFYFNSTLDLDSKIDIRCLAN